MKLRYAQYSMAVAVAAALAGCGSSSTPGAPSAPAPGNAMLLSVPGVSSAVSYSFDLGVYDPATGNYYVTDRTNKSIDWINIGGGWGAVATNPTVHQFKNSSYAGCNSGGTTGGQANLPYIPMPGCLTIAITPNVSNVVNNDLSGPDGVDVVHANLFVGDVNHLWIVNKTTGVVSGNSILIKNTGTKQGFRSDEGCYDPLNHLYATALTGDPNTPFYTVLDTTAHDADATGGTAPVVIAQVLMNDSTGAPAAGLEACAFDTRGYAAGTGMMWLNNDGSTANPNGETDGIPIEDLIAIRTTPLVNKKVVFAGPLTATADFGAATTSAPSCALGSGGCGPTAGKVIALPALCDPTGLALGPASGNDVGAMCRPGTFNQRMDFVILSATNTATPATTIVPGAGGGDQVAYDASSNRYYLSDSRMTTNGKSCFNGGTQVCNLTPKLVAVDAATKAEVGRFDQGNNGHSVAVGAGLVLLPFTNSSTAGGGANFPNGGIAVFPTF